MTLKNDRAPFLCSFKLCVSFCSHQIIQRGVTVRKRSTQVKIGNFWPRVILKFDGWHWKTIGHLFYATLSYVHHFKAIGKFKYKVQSGNAQFMSKSAIYFPCDLGIWRMTLKKTIGHLFYMYAASCFGHHLKAICTFKLKLQSGNAQFGSKLTIFFLAV